MHLVPQHRLLPVPTTTIMKKIVLSVAVVSTLILTGCASKPQINNPTRYATAPDYYTVRSGDTLSGIAARYGLSYLSIAEMNDISAPYRIYVNQSLRLKNSGTRRSQTQPMTQAAPIQRQRVALPTPPPVTTTTRTTVQPTSPTPSIPVRSTTLRWVKPANGPVLQAYNPASNIKGTRFSGNLGDPVFAAADGQVVYAADGLKEYGNLVLIKHIDGYISAYAHNSKMLVKSGDNVTAGQKIAEMGSSGTNQVMLEFQIRLDGKPINPASILPIN
ncbi:peptidoglycan DD-metalloendopeptidase family protein [Acinetobacter radioresistens]|uniref:peptidoglycan DD-metalloendopeptidase family protein n=1 Tax=Acinetobacter radioresistens TaxID=40216 RepID=UPI000DAE2DD7|nr:peptidoglycan DD-metalloendopeptidase family protein [Acinetobacter radioresistens]AWV85852.1 peptidoglycan-binding protein [Acinetobacter radioresistens]MCX0326565.1 peptidoglycan DD-metalloendopeptidase family protein [Acinetobacter radioresistens]HCK63710.1 peptidoglycan-binding protein [Acinetobacter radioresistens]